jgi:hypothetical protein
MTYLPYYSFTLYLPFEGEKTRPPKRAGWTVLNPRKMFSCKGQREPRPIASVTRKYRSLEEVEIVARSVLRSGLFKRLQRGYYWK